MSFRVIVSSHPGPYARTPTSTTRNVNDIISSRRLFARLSREHLGSLTGLMVWPEETEQQHLQYSTAPNENRIPHNPIDKLPLELLSHILTLTWLSYDEDDAYSRFRFPSFPTQVNHFFHYAALSTPIIWSHLQIKSLRNLEHAENRIRRRSGALPLDFEIVLGNMNHIDATKIIESTLLLSSSRCRTVKLSYTDSFIPDDEHFWDHLHLFDEAHPLSAAHLSINAEGAPPLRFLPSLSSSIQTLELYWCRFPWPLVPFPSTIQRLLYREDPGTEVHISITDILRSFDSPLRQSLRSLSLSSIFVDQAVDAQPRSCILSSLEYFELVSFYVEEAAIILGSILTPNLRHLSLGIVAGSDLSNELATTWSAVRFPKLIKLTLLTFFGHQDELGELLANLPDSAICLEVIEGEDSIIDALIRPPTTRFCSRLRHMIMRRVHLANVVSVVEGRCTALKTLELEFRDKDDVIDIHNEHNWESISNYLRMLRSSVKEVEIIGDEGALESMTEKDWPWG